MTSDRRQVERVEECHRPASIRARIGPRFFRRIGESVALPTREDLEMAAKALVKHDERWIAGCSR